MRWNFRMSPHRFGVKVISIVRVGNEDRPTCFGDVERVTDVRQLIRLADSPDPVTQHHDECDRQPYEQRRSPPSCVCFRQAFICTNDSDSGVDSLMSEPPPC